MRQPSAKYWQIVAAVGVALALATGCGVDTSQSDLGEASAEPVAAAEVREDPYERVREVDPTFTVRSTLKVNPCDGRFMNLVEQQIGLIWDASPTAMDGIAGGKPLTLCGFEDDEASVLIVSQGLPFDVMEPNLEPRDGWDLPGAYWWEIGDRRGVVRPMDFAGGTCDVGIETSFGYMSFSGGYHRSDRLGEDCAVVKHFVEQLEPHLWD